MNNFPENDYSFYIKTVYGYCVMEFAATEWDEPASAKLTGETAAVDAVRRHFDTHSFGMWGYSIERPEYCSPMDIHANLTAAVQADDISSAIRGFETIGYVPDELPPEVHPDNHEPDDTGDEIYESGAALSRVIRVIINSSLEKLDDISFIETAKEYARKKFAGKTIRNQTDKSEILIPWQGIKHSFSGKVSRLQASVALELGSVIKYAAPYKAEKDKQGRNTISMVHFYITKVEVDGTKAEIVVVVREHLDGKRYYDHYELKRPAGQSGEPTPSEEEVGHAPAVYEASLLGRINPSQEDVKDVLESGDPEAREQAIFERGMVADYRVSIQQAHSFDDIEDVFANMFGPVVVRRFISGEISDLESKIKAMREKYAQIGAADRVGSAGIMHGEKTTAYLNDNSPIELEYAVVEMGTLITSHTDEMTPNDDFSQDLQPRDRARAGMKLQVDQMSEKLNPERLGESSSVSTGAPIVGPDMTVESGNGRTIAIRKAYAAGGKGKEYKQWLVENAPQFGVSGKAVESMAFPVLVRIRLTEINRSEFARKANEDEIAQMAPAELAKADAAKLTDDDIALFQPSEDGNIAAATNRPFILRFFERLGGNASTGYMTKDGGYTKQLIDRIQAAVFQKAYQDDTLLALMAEEADPGIKNILGAMTIAAGEFAKAKTIDSSLMGIDIPRHVIEAAKLVRKSREDGQTIEEALSQRGLFGDIPEDTAEIALFIDKNIRSAKRMGAVLKAAAQILRQVLIDESQPKLLDIDSVPPTPGQIVALAVEKERESHDKESKLFEAANGTADWRKAIEAAASYEEIAAVFELLFPGATGAGRPKEPWEMTIAEYWKAHPEILSEAQAYAMHFADVQGAVKTGKTVPTEVRNEYL